MSASSPTPETWRPEVAALAAKLHAIGCAESRAYREKHRYHNPDLAQRFEQLDPWQQAGWCAVAEHVMVSQACALREQQELHAMELGDLYKENSALREKGGAS